MNWKDTLKISKSLSNMSLKIFAERLTKALEGLGFEVEQEEPHYVGAPKRMKEWTTLTDEQLEGYDGSWQEQFGHELIVTDTESPFTYGDGYGTDKLTIKYIADDYDHYHNRQNEDYPILAVNSWKVDSIEMTTDSGKKKVDITSPKGFSNSMTGVRELSKFILDSFKEHAEYLEDWSDMSEEEAREFRGERAGHRFAGEMRGLGYD